MKENWKASEQNPEPWGRMERGATPSEQNPSRAKKASAVLTKMITSSTTWLQLKQNQTKNKKHLS